ncbi:MAG: hypothetical protein K0R76_803 [Alphaproteobacteria bacterium]|jgi:hypothetical protein|nr:hypothetical protein [Alphaproteobacteria bacterium]MDF3033849.1 hypothetical protein [Alphaproteobacteria bacterium]
MFHSIRRTLGLISLVVGFSFVTGKVEAAGPTCNSQHGNIKDCAACCKQKSTPQLRNACIRNCNKGVKKRKAAHADAKKAKKGAPTSHK